MIEQQGMIFVAFLLVGMCCRSRMHAECIQLLSLRLLALIFCFIAVRCEAAM